MKEGEEIFHRIIKTLAMKSLSRPQMCKFANISSQGITNIKKQNSIPSADTAIKLAKFLGVSVYWLITGEDEAGLTSEQRILLDKYGKLDEAGHRIALTLIESLIKEFPNTATKEKEMPSTGVSAELASEVREKEPSYTLESSFLRENTVDNVIFLDWDVIEIPYLGQTAAGRPITIAIDPDTPTEKFPRPTIRGNIHDHFCVTVRGTSMTEADIHDGDLALIKMAGKPEDNAIMLVRYGNESTLKRIKIKQDTVYLCWEDGSGKIKVVNDDEYKIQGKLVIIQRKPR